MNFHQTGPFHTMKLFTVETCNIMKNMEVDERRKKLCGLLTAFFQNKMPQVPLAIEIAKEMGGAEELVVKMLGILAAKGATGPSDAPNLMNRQPVRILAQALLMVVMSSVSNAWATAAAVINA